MSQVVNRSEKTAKKRVYFSQTGALKEGYPVCYERQTTGNSDATGQTVTIAIGTVHAARAYRVAKPASGNLRQFAGFIDSESAGKSGPCWATIIQPGEDANGTVCKVWSGAATTGASFGAATKLYLVGGTFALSTGASGRACVAVAAQTSGATAATPAAVQAVAIRPAGYYKTNTVFAAIGLASTVGLKSPTGGTTGGTYALDNVPTGSSAAVVAAIENNFTKVAKVAEQLRNDLDSLKLSLRSTNALA